MTEPADAAGDGSAEIIPLWRARPRSKLAPALADFLDSLSSYPYGEELLRNFGRVDKLGTKPLRSAPSGRLTRSATAI